MLGRKTTAPFTPVTNTYTSGIAATETVPIGATSLTTTVDGGGGPGGRDAFNVDPGGGGGGSRSVKTIAVVGGNTLTYTVGALKAGRTTNGAAPAGNASTVSGTVSGGAVNITANGGDGGGIIGVAGLGGIATGGDVNTPGMDASGDIGGDGAGGGTGGDGAFRNGTAIGGGGAGVTSGTSGSGARGEVKFAYT